jgi:hypothetical protein
VEEAAAALAVSVIMNLKRTSMLQTQFMAIASDNDSALAPGLRYKRLTIELLNIRHPMA